MTNNSIFPTGRCISENENTEGRLCVHLVVETKIAINGEKFQTFVCECENDLCASCIPEFYSSSKMCVCEKDDE